MGTQFLLFNFDMFRFVVAFALLVALAAAQQTIISHTGDGRRDFDESSLSFPVKKEIDIKTSSNQQDVGVPAAVTNAGFTISGWDIEYIAFYWNAEAFDSEPFPAPCSSVLLDT